MSVDEVTRFPFSSSDAESTTNWNEYFTVDTSNGKVTTKKALKNLANNVMRLSVEVILHYVEFNTSLYRKKKIIRNESKV